MLDRRGRKASRKRLIANAVAARALPAPKLLLLPASTTKAVPLPLPFEDDELVARRMHARKVLLMVCLGAHIIDTEFGKMTVDEHAEALRLFDQDCEKLIELNLTGEECEGYVRKLLATIATLTRFDTTLIPRLHDVVEALLDEQVKGQLALIFY
jgi:hypothetical protein